MIHKIRLTNNETSWLSILLVTAVQDDGPETPVHVLNVSVPNHKLRLGRVASSMLPPLIVLLESVGDLQAREEIERMLQAMHLLCEFDTLRATAGAIDRLISDWVDILAKYHACLEEDGTVKNGSESTHDALVQLQ